MRPARGHLAFGAHARPHPHRRSRLKTCTHISFTLCFLTLAVRTIFNIDTNSGSLPFSLNDLEILWETTTRGEDLCHARLQHLGIHLESQQEDTTRNTAATTTATVTTSSRHRLYKAMNGSLSEGLQLDGGTVQGKTVNDLFTRDATSGRLQPIHHPLQTPVRAIVLPVLELSLARLLQESVIRHLVPQFPPNTLWLQNTELLHSTVYHASTHMDPIPATEKDINSEILSILDVAEHLCPIEAILESVVITRTGTVLALWHPAPGSTEPVDLRKNLRQALPKASKKQIVTDTVLLHTTLARIGTTSDSLLSINNARDAGKGEEHSQEQLPSKESLWAAVGAITRELCGMQTRMDALWYVEEQDLLALALNGRVKKRIIPFQCNKRL